MILKRQRKEITASQVVPVWIINLDALMLTEPQVQDNMKAYTFQSVLINRVN